VALAHALGTLVPEVLKHTAGATALLHEEGSTVLECQGGLVPPLTAVVSEAPIGGFPVKVSRCF